MAAEGAARVLPRKRRNCRQEGIVLDGIARWVQVPTVLILLPGTGVVGLGSALQRKERRQHAAGFGGRRRAADRRWTGSRSRCTARGKQPRQHDRATRCHTQKATPAEFGA